jgi:2-oxoglutarate dehydrogenase E2 component (dihydrolipoamide succinyltransferase)
MPQLGETVNEGTVTKWFKNVGDAVVKGEPLFEVSTDKVDSEIPSPASGVVTAILVEEGETVGVGTILAVIGEPGDAPTPSKTEAPAPTSVTVPGSSNAPVTTKSASSPSAPLSPVVRRLLGEHDLEASQISGTGPHGRLTRDDVLAFVASNAGDSPASDTSTSQSPVLRRLLSDSDVDPSTITGTGPDGRITRHDVENALSARQHATTGLRGDEVVPFTKIRRVTAEHMVRSKATSAHTLMVKEVDYEHIEEVRRRKGAAFKEREGFSLTYLAFNAVATLSALRDFPRLNASVNNDELIIHHELNLGIAVDLEGEGLIVPVIRGGDGYDLRTMAQKIRQLADGARRKKLTVDDTAHGTFTISNPGPFATLLTGAIINQPQVAILSTDGVSRKPVVIEVDGVETVVVHSVGLLALTFDHRAVDGAYAARFLNRVDEILNSRDWAAEL